MQNATFEDWMATDEFARDVSCPEAKDLARDAWEAGAVCGVAATRGQGSTQHSEGRSSKGNIIDLPNTNSLRV